jgi:hypothetical protein
MDWITFSKQQVEADALPMVCMVCGDPAGRRISKTFERAPDWVGLLYLLGIAPGLVVHLILNKEMRVGCPLCSKHEDHWTKLYWTAGAGWLIVPLLAGLGWIVGSEIGHHAHEALLASVGIPALFGLVVWIGSVVYLAITRIQATKITDEEITFQRVADEFVAAAKGRSKRRYYGKESEMELA